MKPDLEDTVIEELIRRNADWLQRLFRSYSKLTVRLRVPGEMQGHVYTVHRPVLNTRLGEHTPAEKVVLQGPLCGDNGGQTAKGAACRRKGTGPAGRCAQHPHVSIVPRASAGERLSQAEITFGDDAAIRPIGGAVPWARCEIAVPELDAGLRPIDELGADPLHLTTCTRVWDEQILRIKAVLHAPCEAALVVAGAELPVEPAWTVEMLAERYPSLELGQIDGQALEAGHLLADYGVTAGTALRADKKQEVVQGN